MRAVLEEGKVQSRAVLDKNASMIHRWLFLYPFRRRVLYSRPFHHGHPVVHDPADQAQEMAFHGFVEQATVLLHQDGTAVSLAVVGGEEVVAAAAVEAELLD